MLFHGTTCVLPRMTMSPLDFVSFWFWFLATSQGPKMATGVWPRAGARASSCSWFVIGF